MESQFIFILCTSVISSPISHEWEIAPSLETDSQKDITMSFLILLLLLPLVKLEVLQNSDILTYPMIFIILGVLCQNICFWHHRCCITRKGRSPDKKCFLLDFFQI